MADATVDADEFHEVRTCAILRSRDGSLPPTTDQRDSGGFQALVLDPKFYWNPGDGIHVKFIKPDPNDLIVNDFTGLTKKVKSISQEWEAFANIRFVFDEASDAPVRVGFFAGGGGYSALGTDCESIDDPKKPTICLGVSRNDQDFRSTVLHEFGHVLGCLHEHSSPTAKIDWILERVYKYYFHKHKWTWDEVDEQVLRRYEEFTADHSGWDLESIMIYPIDRYLTRDRMTVKSPVNLSQRDKNFIRQIYPYPRVDESANVFYSWNYHGWDRRDPKNTAFVQLTGTSCNTPAIAVGLTQFDLDNEFPLRVKATAACVTAQGFNIQTETWAGPEGLFSAGATWFKIDNPDTLPFQTGTFDTLQTQSQKQSFSRCDGEVKFPRPFESEPEVVVWIQGFYIGIGSDIGLDVSAQEVGKDSFKVSVDARGTTKLYRAMVTWIAYPKDEKAVCSGVTQSKEMVQWEQEEDNRRGYSTRIPLPHREPNDTKLRVYTGICSFDISGEHNIRLHAEAENEGEEEGQEDIVWIHVKTWNKTNCRSASSSYLAVYE